MYPFLGNPETNKEDPDYGRFDEYVREGKEIFSLTDDPASADFFVLPFEFSFSPDDLKLEQQLDDLAGKYNKRVLVFFNSDLTDSIPMRNAVIFRTSFYRSSRRPNEFAFPGWSLDFMKLGIPDASTPMKPSKPSVSYCGYVDYLSPAEWLSPRYALNRITRRFQRTNMAGQAIRGKAVRALRHDRRIISRFIIRSGFWAPGFDKKLARREYAENIFAADYAIVTRGAGNFSYRLYEVLSCGRIPVFIDTDAVLPFDHLIDWKKFVVWVPQDEVSRIAEKIISFHQSLSDEEFLALKKSCRQLYEDWICPASFYGNIQKCLE